MIRSKADFSRTFCEASHLVAYQLEQTCLSVLVLGLRGQSPLPCPPRIRCEAHRVKCDVRIRKTLGPVGGLPRRLTWSRRYGPMTHQCGSVTICPKSPPTEVSSINEIAFERYHRRIQRLYHWKHDSLESGVGGRYLGRL